VVWESQVSGVQEVVAAEAAAVVWESPVSVAAVAAAVAVEEEVELEAFWCNHF
jgi:hypothetical protein